MEGESPFRFPLKIALLGASGYLGQAYLRSHIPSGLDLIPVVHDRLNYSDPNTLSKFIRMEGIAGVINCAGFTGKPNVDACEDQQKLCFQLNVLLPETLARVCSDEKIPLFQVGSGCIYMGGPSEMDPNRGFNEDDQPNFSFDHPPCSYYSGTKAEMEKRIGKIPSVTIWRLRMPFTAKRDERNLLMKLAVYRKVLEARNSLSDLNEMVAVTLKMLMARAPSGIYNVTNPGVISNYEIVEMLIRHGIREKEPEFFSSEKEILAFMRAPRSSCVLDSSKISRLGFPMREIREALACAMREMTKI